MPILLLEDNDLDAELMAHHLGEALPNLPIVRARDRQSYRIALQAEGVRLIVADFSLPDMDGWDALAMAIGALPDVPFIFVSGLTGEELTVKALKQGATDYVVKQRLARLGASARRALSEAEDRRARHRAEDALRNSEERFRALTESSPALIWETNASGEITFNNRHFETTFGLPTEALLGEGWHQIVDARDLDMTRAALAASHRDHAEFQLELRVIDRHGDVRWLHCKAIPRFDRAGRFLGLTGNNVDITETKRAREELERMVQSRTAQLQQTNERLLQEMRQREDAEIARSEAEEQLRQSQKMEAFGQLTGGVAHDFNNFLTVILGNIETIERLIAGSGANPRIQAALAHARQGAQRAAALTQRLLAFARRQPLQPRRLDVNRLIAGTSEILTRTLGEQITVQTELQTGLWDTNVDPHMLESALLNLAVNARDAMPDGGVLLLRSANASLTPGDAEAMGAEAGDYVMLTVRDNGTGIPAHLLNKVFEPFFTTKDVGAGTGLGLSQVYGFVKQSGGHIAIESTPGEGTTVHLYLPRDHAAAERDPAPAPDPRIPRGYQGEGVLVVEDNPDVRAHSVGILKELGYTVAEAGDGPAALALLEIRPDIRLLFTDVGLPNGMNGRELAQAARARWAGLRVLYTSGYAEGGLTQGGRLPPGEELLPKPFTFAQLAQRVRDIMDMAAAAGPNTMEPPPAAAPSSRAAPQAGASISTTTGQAVAAEQARPATDTAGATMTSSDKNRVLVVEDDELVRIIAVEALGDAGYATAESETAAGALQALSQEGNDIGAAIVDLGLPDMKGDELVRIMADRYPGLAIVVASGYGAEALIESLPAGIRAASVQKPYPLDQLFQTLRGFGIAPGASGS